MNPNWFGTICAGGALAAFFFTYRGAMKVPSRRRLLLAVGALLLAIPSASFAGYYAHVFPEPSWYFEFRSWPGVECLLIVLGIAGGLVASLLPRKLLILPLFGSAAFALAPILKPFIRPILAGTLHDQWDGEICLQSTPSTCGAASVASILRTFGIKVTEGQLAREAHTYLGGTEGWYLARVIRARGCRARFQCSPGFDPEIPFPAVAGVRLGEFGHFIAILSRTGDRFHVGDPLLGPEVLSRRELLERYDFTGFYMAITKGEPSGAATASPALRPTTNREPSSAGSQR